MSNQVDIPGLALNSAVMVSMAVPVAGPGIAALLSIVSGIYEGTKKEYGSSFSIAGAIGDIGNKINTALQNQAVNDRLAKIQSWQSQANALSTDFVRASTKGYIANPDNRTGLVDSITIFHNQNKDYEEVFKWFEDLSEEDQVKNLELYFTARASYHTCCFLMLKLNAVLEGGDSTNYAETPSTIIDDYFQSLSDAIDFGEQKWKDLDYAFDHVKEEATAKSVKDYPNPGVDRNLDFASLLVEARRKAHLDCISKQQIDRIHEYLAAFKLTKEYLASYTAAEQKESDDEKAAAAWALLQAALNKTRISMGKKPANAVRFLYEYASSGSWVLPLEDSPLAPGSSVASQNAGSTLPKIYYKVGGGTLNQQFEDALTRSGQITTVNKLIEAAYNAKYGSGAYKTDSSAGKPRQDRLTSFVIPVDQSNPVGDNVYAMVYSVGPQLTSLGIVDKDGYKLIYIDALTGISQWNNKDHPQTPIKNFRITMLSTGAFGSAAVMPDSASLIIQAVKEAAKADASLADLTILVSSNYTNDPPLAPTAFDGAAKAAGVKNSTIAGFDLPLS